MDHLFGEKGISSNFVSWRVKSIAVSDEEAKGENVVCDKSAAEEALFHVITGETGSS